MIRFLFLGRVPYGEAIGLQSELAESRYQGRIGNLLLLLEHPPVVTLGRHANPANILAPHRLLASRGIAVHATDRGGDVTYHGPGQLVGYPIFDLRSLRNPSGSRMGPVDFVRLIEEALIRLCGGLGVRAGRIAGLTGVWCGLPEHGAQPQPAQSLPSHEPSRKIAAIGIHVARGITSHGFALNVTTDLSQFALILPCGIAGHPVTSLEREVERQESDRPRRLPGLEGVAQQAARQFGLVFSQQVLAVESLPALRAQMETTAPAEFPAEDTPA